MAVVEEREATPLIEACEIVETYTDNFIMSGFIDAHLHLINSALLERDGILRYTTSEEEAAKLLWDIHKDRKNIKWILGGAWDSILWADQSLPTRKSLDKYFKDIPVFLLNKEGHGAWTNSKLLEMFHITKDTADPPFGAYFRDETGEPTGYIHEAACDPILNEILSRISDEEIIEYVKAFISSANSKGITAVCDLAANMPIRENAYKLMEERGELNCRIRFYKPLANGVRSAVRMKEEYASPMLSCGGVKAFIDGTPQGHTGYMAEDYSDMPGERSRPLIEPEILDKMVAEYDEAGIAVRIHACGDQGAHICLDAFEKAKEKNKGLHARHCVEHLEAMLPEDIPRFGKLGVVASVQPEHMPKYDFSDHPFHKILGSERMKYSYPFGSIRKNGGLLAYGTDCPVADIAPYRGIYRSVNRLTNEGEPEGGWNPEERVNAYESLMAYTRGSAYAADMEHLTGTLEKGKKADFIVVERNLLECASDLESMFRMRTLLTVVDGKIVHEE